MDLRLLGPVEVVVDGRTVRLVRRQERFLLAVLALELGRFVAVERLVDLLWREPPPRARGGVAAMVSHLRSALAAARPSGVHIRTGNGGYALEADPETTDLYRFRTLLERGRNATSGGERIRLLDEALRLWRGPALAGAADSWQRARVCGDLDEMRVTTQEEWLQARLDAGEHRELVDPLTSLIGEHPLRERLRGQLMTALYRCGRRPDALEAYRQARRTFVEELGLEPGPQLRALQQAILGDDPALVRPAAGGPAPMVPAQLPAAVPHFTGRAGHLKQLDALLPDVDSRQPAAVVIDGTAGVGKTVLALQWAHAVADRFPDGQLYVNLRGYDADEPVAATDALAGFLRALGVDGPDIPPDPAERAARYRSLLAGRRVLVVLDNARQAQQVRPLLPAGGGCVALVTSRDSLAGLVARDGAVRLELDVLTPAEAGSLLRSLLGSRVAAEPGPAEELAALCSRLPLALRITAELATARPTAPLADLVEELADQRRRLDLLRVDGDCAADVRSVLSWSYRHLEAATARAFRLIGLHPGSDFDTYATAALTGTTHELACRALVQLSHAHLVQGTGAGRYGMHDLLRDYARELADAEDEQERRAALTGLFDYYLYTAASAVDVLFPAGADRRLHPARPAGPVPPVGDEPTARAWLDAERANLAAVAARAPGHGLPRHAVDLSATLFWYLDYGGHLSEAHTIHSSAVHSAAQLPDPAAQAHALINLGGVALRRSCHRQAADHYRQALALCRDSGDRFGELRALGSLAAVDQRESRYEQAADHYGQVLDLSRELGIRTHEIRALTTLGQLDLLRGRHGQAAAHLGLAVDLCREVGDHNSRADALVGLAEVDLRESRFQRARSRLEEARAVYRETGNRSSDVHAVYYLGILELREGRHQQAVSLLQQARMAFHDSGDRTDEAHALCRLAELDVHRGRHQQAMDQLQQASNLCRQTGDRAGQAQTLNALGEVLLAASQPGQALDRHRDALGIAVQIGAVDEQSRARHGLARAHAALGTQEVG